MTRLLTAALLALAACSTESPDAADIPEAPAASATDAVVEDAVPNDETPDADEIPEGCHLVDLGERGRGAYEIPVGTAAEHHGDEAVGSDDPLHRAVGHMKVNFTMPEGTTRLETRAKMSEPWEIRWDIGTGGCPHSGQSLATAVGTQQVELTLASTALEGAPAAFAADERWFAHLAILGEEPPEEGAVAGYEMRVLACE